MCTLANTLQTAMDCGYPVCQSITGGQVHSANLSYIAAVCRYVGTIESSVYSRSRAAPEVPARPVPRDASFGGGRRGRKHVTLPR